METQILTMPVGLPGPGRAGRPRPSQRFRTGQWACAEMAGHGVFESWAAAPE